MKVSTPTAPVASDSATPAKVRRTRVFPQPFRLVLGACLLGLAFISFLSFAWFAGDLLITGDRTAGFFSLGSLVFFGLSRLLAFLNNQRLHCNLCHGTVLHEKRCRKHASATRIPGLSYRAAAVAAILTTGQFRCMYCGTSYQLKK